MEVLFILGIAFGLSMDAFAVAIGTGLRLGRVSGRQTFRLAFHFGLFQSGMPLAGWLAGVTIVEWIAAFDHWVAFAMLAFVGGKMIFDSFRHEEGQESPRDPTRGGSLVLLSVATSVDALAVGLSLGLLDSPVLIPALVIGLVCSGVTAAGLHLGRRLGTAFGERMEALGGAVLVAIGLKILIEHLVE
jgi:putative Mn2+ efflux pump MntP